MDKIDHPEAKYSYLETQIGCMRDILTGNLSTFGFPIIQMVLINGQEGDAYKQTKPLNCIISTSTAGFIFARPDVIKEFSPALSDKTIFQQSYTTGQRVESKIYTCGFAIPKLNKKVYAGELIELDALPQEAPLMLGAIFLEMFKFTYNGQDRTFTLELVDTIHKFN